VSRLISSTTMYWFWVHPSVWGESARPLQGERTRLKLVESKFYDFGVTLLRYEPAPS